jgi:hypothetical protein
MLVIPDIILVVQVTTFILFTISLILGLIWMKANSKLKYMELPAIALAAHILVFYIVSWLQNGGYMKVENPIVLFTSWSAILRLQTAMTFVGLAILRTRGSEIRSGIISFLNLPFSLYNKIIRPKREI